MHYETIFNHPAFIVINKPSGLLSIPDREGKEISLKKMLEEKYEKIYTVHRLDKETSGLILFAKTEDAHKKISALFESRDIEKYYLGLVHGKMSQATGSINAAIMEHPSGNGKMATNAKGKPSLTDYEVVDSFRLYSLVRFRIHTGRTHQVRVHAQYIGHSIVCDPLYGDAKPFYVSSLKRNFKLSKSAEEEKALLHRLALHAWQLKFNFEDKPYFFEASLPKDIKATLQQLRKAET